MMIPGYVDVSDGDYVAKKLNNYGEESTTKEARQRPFLICHNEPITLRVVTWLGKELLWDFPGDGHPYPMPLKKILKSDDNSISTNIRTTY
jgi:hypothetical protein